MKNLIRTLFTFAISIALSVQTSAATDADRGVFDIEYENPKVSTNAKQSSVETESIALSCSVNFSSLVDSRANKETIGTNGAKALRPKGFDKWLLDFKTQTLDTLGKKEDAGEADIQVDAEVVRLYSYAQAMSIRGVIAMKLTIKQDDTSEIRYVRGYSSKTNWANGISEYGTAATKASHDVVEAIKEELQPFCS